MKVNACTTILNGLILSPSSFSFKEFLILSKEYIIRIAEKMMTIALIPNKILRKILLLKLKVHIEETIPIDIIVQLKTLFYLLMLSGG